MIILMVVSTTLIALIPTTECRATYPKLVPANDLIPTRPPITITTRISPEERRKLSFFPKNPIRYIVTERSKITTEMLDSKKSTILPKMHLLMKSKTSLDKSEEANIKLETTRSPILKLKLKTTHEPTIEKVTTIKPTQKYIEEIMENTQNPELYDSYDSEEVNSSENEQFEENSNESDGSEILESDESDLLAMATHSKSIAVTNTRQGTLKAMSNETNERSPTKMVKNKLNSSEREKENKETTARNESNLSTIQRNKDDSKNKLKRSIIEEEVKAVTVIGYYIPTKPSHLKSQVNYNNINM